MKRLPIILGVVLWCAPLHAAEPTVDYLKHVKPLLTTKCVSCHGALKQESGLRLDASSLILKGGDSGQAVVAGKSSSSLLIQRVSSNDEDERMPPTEEGDHLTAEQIELLARWIDDGANAPREEVPPDPRSHWAFQPISRPAIPTPTNKAWVRNDIDALIAVEHERSGLKPAPATSKELLLRRLYLDLVGLPPTQLELHAFLNDSSPQAFEHVVDRLLDSPQYGERWGRHWMDVWRYSDWAGFGNEIRYSQRHVWRWRDWIIESLNEDKGYDQMVVEMLAADEAAPADENAVRATGFLARNWYKFDRNVWLDDVVEHSGKAFLGMTFKCARCHDHKYDPISQMEYYRLRAIFEPYDVRTDGVAGEPDVTKNGLARVYDATADAKTYFFKRGDPKQADREHPLEPNVPSVIAGEFNVQPIELSVQSYYPAIQINITRDLQARAETAVEAAEKNLQSARQQLADFQDPQDDPAVQDKPQEPPTPNVATPNVPAPADSTPLTDKPEVVFLDDDFAKNDLKAWKSIRGQWEAVDGHLEQKQIVSTFSPLVTVGNHPSDFAASMEFKPTGGNVYRSVGFSFDWVADRDFQAVYLSAKDGASTVSAFHRRNGADAYPANAVVPHPIKVGQRAKLEVLVRGDLLNLKVDGQLKLAYRLPVPRQQGKFAIWTYDAAAEFYRVKITELSTSAKLAPASTGVTANSTPTPAKPTPAKPTRQAVEQAVKLAEKKVATAKTQLASIIARINAERAKYQISTSPSVDRAGQTADQNANQTANQTANQIADGPAKLAGQAELLAKLANADETLFLASRELSQAQLAATQLTATPNADAKLKQAVAAAEKKLTAAQKSYDDAKQASLQESKAYSPLGPTYPKTSTGRRTAFAHWIVDRKNPLTARVAVNHIWMRHFGSPLVAGVDDFGLRSDRPQFSALLDYLAVELMENNWSMKHVHRLIVNSNAYRMSSVAADEASLQKDPDNKGLWRMSRRRMEAETVRDAILHVAGSLDLQRGGADIDHNQGMAVQRRSLYFRHARERQMPFLQIFDPANPRECYRRQESIRPQQAFALVNSSLAITQSRKLAGTLSKQEGIDSDDDAFIRAACEVILSRGPSEKELYACRTFLVEQETRLSDLAKLELLGNATNPLPAANDPKQRARENLVLVLFNHNDFVTIR